MFGHNQVIDKLEKISDAVNVVRSDVDVIKSSVQTLDRRGTTAGVQRSQELADVLDGSIKNLRAHGTLLKDTVSKVEKINKFIFGGGALSGGAGLLAYFNGFFG